MTTYDEILSHPYWRHRIDLGEGKFTPGKKDASHWGTLGLPDDLSGKTFLDIGAFDGLHSFEAERRGAVRVLATDIWDEPTADEEWWNSLRPGKEGFDLAYDYLNSTVESKVIGVEELSPDTVGKFDIVLCSGVIYHLKEPLSAIENAVSVANELVVVESAIQHDFHSPAGMKLLKGTERNNDPSNWWVPNLEGLRDMVSIAGCDEVTAGYTPIDEGSCPVPPWTFGIVTSPAAVHRSPDLEDQIGNVAADTEIYCLMSVDGSERVEYRDGQAKVQGWIPQDSIQYRNYSSNVLKKGIQIIGNEGVIPFLTEAYYRFTTRPPRGVVHGYVSTTAD